MPVKKLRGAKIEKLTNRLLRFDAVDLCFVIDATKSMGKHIARVKTVISGVVGNLKRSSERRSHIQIIRISCVAYRDYCDEKQFEILDFTDDVEKFTFFLDCLVARGGGDTPEDVLGGLKRAQTLSWSPTAGVRQIFHLCDAPPHGRRYHNFQSDDFPEGHPNDPTVEELFRWMDDKNVQYVFGKVNHFTDLMISIFKDSSDRNIETFSVKDVYTMATAIEQSVTVCVRTAIMKTSR